MTSPFLLLAVPVVLAILVFIFSKQVRLAPGASGLLLAVSYIAVACILLEVIFSGKDYSFAAPWVPQLGVDFSLRLTAFNAWFSVLIFGLGSAIVLYAASYFSKHPRLPFLLISLLLFTTAMLGVVMSDNFFLLFLFWEATSLLSFLLVGFHHEKEDVRAKASQALLVTFFGGAVMLAGFILLNIHSGANSLSSLLEADLTYGPLLTASIILITLGALTKSAQFPFHFWLPNAMAGPTPVSAYLHSATMVKAGVFLLATLAPALSSHWLWTPLLVASGLFTAGVAISRGWKESDMKGMLANTTLAALGFLTVLAGIGSPAALLAFVIFLTAHALYKAPLFLAAGNLEKQFGTRELPALRGGIHNSPVTGAVVVLSIASLYGLPPFPGFLAKEYLLKALWAESPWLAILSGIIVAGILTLGLKILLPLLSRTQQAPSIRTVPPLMTVATLIPALLAILLTVLFPWSNLPILGAAAESLGAYENAKYAFWHGWTPALGIGIAAWIIAAVAIIIYGAEKRGKLIISIFEEFFNLTISIIRKIGSDVSSLLEGGSLIRHLSIILATIGCLSVISLDLANWPELTLNQPPDSLVFFTTVPALILSAILSARARSPIAILMSLGFLGLLIAFLFLWFSAPDLALTQLLAEALLLFLLAGVLFKYRSSKEKSAPPIFRMFFSIGSGLLVTLLILKSMTLEWAHPVSDYYITNSKSAAFGENVVNVILVDFRALDTLGEIVVLAIAAMGANAALGSARQRAPLPGNGSSPWLVTALPVLMTFLIPIALWIFWRGHNAPGGGFIAALLVATAIGLGLLNDQRRLRAKTMRTLSRRLLIIGLSLSLLSALSPLFISETFFRGLWWHSGDLHLGTPLLFDLGVFLTVIGFSTSYLRHFHISRPSL